MKTFGIDISRWQGSFDFDKAISEGVEFAIIKGGGGDDGLYVDSKFTTNYDTAKAKGLPIGVYWFSKALTVDAAKSEAEYFYANVLKGRKFELPVYIDVENKTQLAVGKRLLTDIIKAWCSYLEEKDYWVGIYSSKSFFSTYMYDEELTCYAHWVASWTKTCSYTPTSCFGMWQFGGETNLIRTNKVAGQTCDQDYMLVDYPTLIKAAGKNGYGVTATKSVDELAQEVINGQWGNGDDRKARLTAAGYDYAAVQAKVNAMLAAPSVDIDALAREVIRGDWGNGTERKTRLTAEYGSAVAQSVQDRVNQLLS